ncbi:MAG TPA: hypothetical protein VE981_24010 [Planctomycetota bacterium]|nr:hypothetical protein [Planctomycetota bacterium]
MTELRASLLRGSLGFGAVSVAAFSVWAFGGKWLGAHFKEYGFYVVMALVFIALSLLILYKLVRGPNSFARFAKAYIPAFLAYSVAWCASWYVLKWVSGEILGSLAGSVAFAAVVGWSLGNLKPLPKAALVLFIGHSAGYFLGGPIHYALKDPYRVVGILGWGLVFGLGFGAGIGYVFHVCQEPKPAT